MNMNVAVKSYRVRCVRACVRACVCVRERERDIVCERVFVLQGLLTGLTAVCVCVCVCVCVLHGLITRLTAVLNSRFCHRQFNHTGGH